MRRRRFVFAIAALLSLATLAGLRLLAARLERRIEARIATEAAELGAVARVERARVGLWPPLRLDGVVVEKAGAWRARLDDLSARPRLLGCTGMGPCVRLALGPATVAVKGGLELRLHPAAWDWDGQSRAELAEPVAGLSLRGASRPDSRDLELRTEGLDAARLVEIRLEQATLQPGRVDGELHWESQADRSLQARFRLGALGAEWSGAARLVRSSEPARLQLDLKVDRLDFASLFAALGLEPPFAAEALGSLRAEVGVAGPPDDLATIALTQRLDYTPPSKLPPALLRLRGDFVHEVMDPGGTRLRIDVSPAATGFTALPDVPALFVRTLLLAEDSAFFSHPGLDLSELPTALAANLTQGGAVRGASTITQQLAKNLFLSREKSLTRKLQELVLAFLLEAALGKERILEIYLNVIEWGPGLHGLRPAARHYFGKEPQQLSPKEMAFLVVLIPGPIKYQRSFNQGALSSGLEPLVANLLAKLRSVDALSEEEYAAALEETLVFRRPEESEPSTGSKR